MLYGDIHHQRLSLVNTHAVADSIDYLEIRFRFLTEDWDGVEKWAHFACGETVYDIPLTDDRIRKEDHLNLTEGEWTVFLHGNRFADGAVTERITTECFPLHVITTGVLHGEPFPELPASESERILARLDALEKTAGESAYAAAQIGGYTGTAEEFYADLAAVEELAAWFAAY